MVFKYLKNLQKAPFGGSRYIRSVLCFVVSGGVFRGFFVVFGGVFRGFLVFFWFS